MIALLPAYIVLPMYMGVILNRLKKLDKFLSAPHVYGGDPTIYNLF